MVKLPRVMQSAGWDCGRAVALAVCKRYCVPTLPDPWPGTPADGTDPRTLEAVLWASGLSVQAGVMTVADLRHHTESEDRPVIVLTRFQGDGHYQIVTGARRRRVYYHCPVEGPRSEPEAGFVRRWRDIDRWGVHWHRFGIAAWKGAE